MNYKTKADLDFTENLSAFSSFKPTPKGMERSTKSIGNQLP